LLAAHLVRLSVGRGRSGDETRFGGRGREEYMKVEVLGGSIIVGSDREHGK